MAEPVYLPVVGFARGVFAALRLKFDISGEEHVPARGGGVVAINHTGYLDFALAGLAFRPRKRLVRFMAKKEVFDHKVSGPLMRGMKHIPVDREAGAGSYQAAVDALRSGELVGVFPEATISQSFELKEFKTGAARMAQEAGVPIVPVVVWGSQRVWTKGRKREFNRRGTSIRIVVGEPFVPAGDAVQGTKELKERMQVLLDEARATYQGAPRDAEDTWWVPAAVGGTAPTLEAAEAKDAQVRADRAAKRAARAGDN
ncbi:MAG: 2-acyl-glycerophospho-ethanolamine acyltransferase [Frankiales bacterium]|jgi:1-acyl-sn-glycerol-3-phosphate acyltransferase|nr:2-acyl-glycerophospho-ethanolamine acyltransferase [Frankiales bacterium]MCW2585784.1 2-acyl-glycerophospho-ethanolamine acyltransferase [Frankiales bacterium]